MLYDKELNNNKSTKEKICKKTLTLLKEKQGASLVVQWLRICLPTHGTRVRALVQEDPTCHGATKPMRHNC